MRSIILLLLVFVTAPTTRAFFWPFKQNNDQVAVETSLTGEFIPPPPPPQPERTYTPLPPKAKPKGKVMKLDHLNFNKTVQGSGKWVLVEFYAPWCDHCKALAPEWELLASAFTPDDPVIIATIDAEEHGWIADEHNVDGYPSIKLFSKEHSVEDFANGDPNADALLTWLSLRTGIRRMLKAPKTAVTKLTAKNFDAKALGSKAALVEFYAPWCGHCKEISPIYEKVAEAFAIDDDKVIIGKVDGSKDTGLTTKYSVESFPTFIFFPANSSEPDKGGFYNGPPELEPIVDYVNFKVDLQRQADGKLKFDIGLVPPLDALLGANGYPPRCMGFPLNATFVETFTATLEGLEGTELEHGTKYYLPAVKKIAEQGMKHVDEEIKRMEGLIKDKKMDPKKRYELEVKRNVYTGCLYMLVGR